MLYAVSCLLVWLFLSGLEVAVAGSTSTFKLAIITNQGPFNWSIAPALLGAFTLALYWFRITRHSIERAPILQNRLQRLTLLVSALIAHELLALISSQTATLPSSPKFRDSDANLAALVGAS